MNLRSLIYANGLTVEQFADAIDVTERTAYNWLAGKTPTNKHIDKICKLFNVKIAFVPTT